MTPEEYCQDKAAKSGSSFYYSFLFLPPEQRRAITGLYAFCREVDDVVDECSEPALARLKLHWWRRELEMVYNGNPEHPVSRELKTIIADFDLSLELFQEIINGMEMDLDQTHYASFKDLSLYCYRVAGVVGLLAVEIFGYRNHQSLKYARNLGIAFQLTNILRDVHEDAMRGRVYLPQDELDRYGISTDILSRGETSEGIRSLFDFQARRAGEYYAKAFAMLPDEDRFRQRSGIIMAEIYQATLNEIRNDGYRILEHRIALTPLRKLWIAWKTALRENRRQRKAIKG